MTKKLSKTNIEYISCLEFNTKLKKLKIKSLGYILLFIIIANISDFIMEQAIFPTDNWIVNIICGLMVGTIYYFMSKSKLRKMIK